MTPQEARLIDELFDRLASLESAPRDPDALQAIADGLKRAPNATYPLVQTVLVQDEALKRADARIRELQEQLGDEPEPAPQGGFLDNMRDALLGRREPHGSVPTVRPGAAGPSSSAWGNMNQQSSTAAPPSQPFSGGGSFLGTAAATAAGVVGGALLMNSMRGLFGGHGAAQGALDPGSGGASPWGAPASDSGLAREAGIDSIGRDAGQAGDDRSQSAGLFDAPSGDDDSGSFDDGGDFDVAGDSDGGSDDA
jgi:hypothetical protein